MQPSILAKRAGLLLFLAVFVTYLYGLGHLPLVGPDEPRYAEVAREMFQRHDLITPTLGGHPWFEKPVLLYWMMMASFAIFGISEWAIRLGPALSGFFTLVIVYLVARRVERASSGQDLEALAFSCVLATASSAGIIVFSRAASFDMVLTMTTSAALGLFLTSELEDDKRRCSWLLAGFYATIGLCLLAKGLVGIVIPFGVVVAYYALRRRLPEKNTLTTAFWGIPLSLVVAAVWYGPVIARHGWLFIDQFFIQHHFARYLSNKYHHPQPVYFYLPILILLSLPWTPFLVGGLVKAREWQWRSDDAESKFRSFALAWLLVPIVFFSISVSKLPAYILPALPAAALLAGDRLAALSRDRPKGRWMMQATGLLLVLGGVLAFVYTIHSANVSFRCGSLVAAPLMFAGGSVILRDRHGSTDSRSSTLSAVLILSATLSATAIALNCVVGNFASRESARELIKLADARGYGSLPVFALHEIERSVEFYATGRVVYAPDGEPLKFEGVSQVAEAARRKQGPILVMVPVQYVSQLSGFSGIQAEVIGDNGRWSLVTVRAR